VKQQAIKTVDLNVNLSLADVTNIDIDDEIIDDDIDVLEGYFDKDAWKYIKAIGADNIHYHSTYIYYS
jgi:DNA-binding protein YbaB